MTYTLAPAGATARVASLNTVVSTRTDRTTLFRLSTNDEHCDARNNVFYPTAAGSTVSLLDASGVLALSHNWNLAGEDYTIADVVSWPWASLLGRLIDEEVWTTFPNLQRWVDEVGAQPAVERGRALHKDWGERQLSEDEQRRRKALLFNQTNASVRAAREAAAKATS